MQKRSLEFFKLLNRFHCCVNLVLVCMLNLSPFLICSTQTSTDRMWQEDILLLICVTIHARNRWSKLFWILNHSILKGHSSNLPLHFQVARTMSTSQAPTSLDPTFPYMRSFLQPFLLRMLSSVSFFTLQMKTQSYTVILFHYSGVLQWHTKHDATDWEIVLMRSELNFLSKVGGVPFYLGIKKIYLYLWLGISVELVHVCSPE